MNNNQVYLQSDKIDQFIDFTNNNLIKLYPNKHKIITKADLAKVYNNNLLSINADAKTVKGYDKGYLTGILYLAPNNLVGFNTCKAASQGCKSACLFSAGRGKFYSVYRARAIKTLALINNPDLFMQALIKSIDKLNAKAKKQGFTPVIRLNGTSDLSWRKITAKSGFNIDFNIFDVFSDLQFYDYTKDYSNIYYNHNLNYHLTFSKSEVNDKLTFRVLSEKINVAVVFKGDLPDYYNGYKVIDGDKSDLRFLDEKGVIVGLKAKGQAKKDQSGFVIDINQSSLKSA